MLDVAFVEVYSFGMFPVFVDELVFSRPSSSVAPSSHPRDEVNRNVIVNVFLLVSMSVSEFAYSNDQRVLEHSATLRRFLYY